MEEIDMKKIVAILLLSVISTGLVMGQDEDNKEKPKDRPVAEVFGAGLLIDNQTCFIPEPKSLEFLIQHRFGKMNNGISDVWGIYSPGANIRLGLNWVPVRKLQLGYGLMKEKMFSDFQIKYNLLEQTRKDVVPVFVTLYGNLAVDGRSKDVFGSNYTFTNRFAYFTEVIVGRKFNDWFSLEARGNFTHYNRVQEGTDHDKIGVGFDGRLKFSPQSALHFQFNVPLKIQSISEYKTDDNEWVNPAKPAFGIGYEVNTGAHSFQIYITSAKGILPQEIYMYNQDDWTKGTHGLMFGFTVNRLWGF